MLKIQNFPISGQKNFKVAFYADFKFGEDNIIEIFKQKRFIWYGKQRSLSTLVMDDDHYKCYMVFIN
jgi:hypothetical protein